MDPLGMGFFFFFWGDSHRHHRNRTCRDSAITIPLKLIPPPLACPSLLALGYGTEVQRAFHGGWWGPHFEQWKLPAILPVPGGILPLPPHLPGRICCVLYSALLYWWEIWGKVSTDLQFVCCAKSFLGNSFSEYVVFKPDSIAWEP